MRCALLYIVGTNGYVPSVSAARRNATCTFVPAGSEIFERPMMRGSNCGVVQSARIFICVVVPCEPPVGHWNRAVVSGRPSSRLNVPPAPTGEMIAAPVPPGPEAETLHEMPVGRLNPKRLIRGAPTRGGARTARVR